MLTSPVQFSNNWTCCWRYSPETTVTPQRDGLVGSEIFIFQKTRDYLSIVARVSLLIPLVSPICKEINGRAYSEIGLTSCSTAISLGPNKSQGVNDSTNALASSTVSKPFRAVSYTHLTLPTNREV